MCIERLTKAVITQHYEGWYVPQMVPLVGALVSIPSAVIAAAQAVTNIAKSIFAYLNGQVQTRSANEWGALAWEKQTYLQNAQDHGVVFANNLLNICSLGFLNAIVVRYVCHQISQEKVFD